MNSNIHINLNILVINIDPHHHKHASHRAALVVCSIISDVGHLLALGILAKRLTTPILPQLRQKY